MLPERIARVRAWVDGVLAGEGRPSADLVVAQFLEPLLEQVGWDLGAETAECLRGRLGLDGEVLTLQTLADEFDLSRERIRQLTGRAGDALAVRWPEARHLLDDFYEYFRPHADAAEAAALVGRTMDLLFNVEVSGDETPAEVLEKWRKVGRNRLTPLTTDELLSWAAGACPGVKPEIARGWIDAACPAVPSGGMYAADGETLHLHRGAARLPAGDVAARRRTAAPPRCRRGVGHGRAEPQRPAGPRPAVPAGRVRAGYAVRSVPPEPSGRRVADRAAARGRSGGRGACRVVGGVAGTDRLRPVRARDSRRDGVGRASVRRRNAATAVRGDVAAGARSVPARRRAGAGIRRRGPADASAATAVGRGRRDGRGDRETRLGLQGRRGSPAALCCSPKSTR